MLLEEIKKFDISKNDSRGKPRKYSYKSIINILVDKFILGICWRGTSKLKSNSDDIPYNTIFNRYQYLVKNNIILDAYQSLLRQYHIKIDNSTAYIDTTSIINKYGLNTHTSYCNYVMRKHRTCKLSIIVSKNNISLGY